MSRPSDFNSRAGDALRVVLAVSECIQAPGTVPSGHLFARLMGHMDIESYQSVIATLVRAGLVRQHPSHLLEWIGPTGPTTGPTTESNQTNNQKEN